MRAENMPSVSGISTGFAMRLMLALLMLSGVTGTARADGPLYTGNGFNDANHGVTFAMELIPVTDILVTELGVFDGGLDGPGLQTAHDVGLWASDGTLLATATVDNNDGLQNGFRFAAITPVTLNAGQNYILGAYFPAGKPGDKLVGTILTPAPLANLVSTSLFEGGPALVFPNPANTSPDFRITANLLFTEIVKMRTDCKGHALRRCSSHRPGRPL